jgi:hypothetical protein
LSGAPTIALSIGAPNFKICAISTKSITKVCATCTSTNSRKMLDKASPLWYNRYSQERVTPHKKNKKIKKTLDKSHWVWYNKYTVERERN